MNYIYGIILGLIQGLGEFLPVSSSGHLLLMKKLLGLPPELLENNALDILLHLGTLVAVIIAFRKTVWRMITGFCGMIAGIFRGTFKWRKANRYQVMAVYVIVATLPLFLVALVQHYFDYSALLGDNLLFVGIMLMVTAGLLFIGDHSVCRNRDIREMQPGQAVKLGLFQAIATLPGLSRSGTTISMAMNMGFDRQAAIEFSFMMSIPAVIGANILHIGDIKAIGAANIGMFLVALATAVVAGLGAISLLKYLVKKERFGWFVIYCLIAGAAAIVLNFVL